MYRSISSAITGAALLCGVASAAPLTVSIDGVEDRGGKFYISVQSESEFMKDEGTAGDVLEAIEAGTVLRTYDLPEGRYAVSVWHDENGNGEFDITEVGMPLDGWAMSGRPLTGPPKFDDVAVTVPDIGSTVYLDMTYHR
ncbi:MAG: DUF2141 domain-containing protein [Pseudomonadota bacterium]